MPIINTPTIQPPITPTALEQPVVDKPTPSAARRLESSTAEVAWPWQLWAAAIAFGSVALGAGGYATHRHWGRRQVNALGEE